MGGTTPTAKPKAGCKALRLKIPGTTATSRLKSPVKRASILPQKNVDLWSDPEDTYIEITKHDLFHNPANKLSFTPLGDLPEHPQRETVPVDITLSATAPEAPKHLVLPNRPSHNVHKAHRPLIARKKVRWDPSIVATGPVITQKFIKSNRSVKAAQTELKVLKAKEPLRHIYADSFEMVEAVKIIKKWTKDDTAKLKNVLQALKDLGFDDEEGKAEPKYPKLSKDVEVALTKVKSLNPRVPEFKSLACSNKILSPEKESQEHSFSKEVCVIDTLKENFPTQQLMTTSSSRPATVRKRTICDDYQDHGRTVAAFDHWYAEKQLLEFMKKYPMTGKKAPVIKKKASTRPYQHEMVKTGLTHGRHAAVIQQRLEFLLWKAKEKDALKAALAAQVGIPSNYKGVSESMVYEAHE